MAFAVCGRVLAALPEVIVVPDSPSAVESTAAKELGDHLMGITGRRLEIVRESEQPAGKGAFLVGDTSSARKEFSEPFGYDGIGIRTVGEDIILAGHPRRGTLYAVYTLLEKYAGVRWFASDATVIPKNPNLVFGKLDEIYNPPLTMRETHYTDAYRTPFAARLKNNGHFASLPEEFGGHESIIGFCHTFAQILPPGKYFKEHPEWYCMIGGKRQIPRHHQLCMTNEEMRKEFIRNALALIEKNPKSRIISISQNDGGFNCQCPDCRRVDEEEGSPSGTLLRFVNAVAAEIGKAHPDMIVDTLAYAWTRKAPKVTRPAENVSIRYCDIEADFSAPIATGKHNSAIADDVSAWGLIAPQMLVWHYTGQFANVMLPYPTWPNYSRDIDFYIGKKARGMFLEGNTYVPLGDFVEMRAWVLSHLLWEPSLNQDALVDEFLAGYYGAAAPELRKYLDYTVDVFRRSGQRLNCLACSHVMHWLAPEDVVAGDGMFESALAAVKSDGTLTTRVLRARSGLDAAAFAMHPYLQSVGRTGIFSAEKWREKAATLEGVCRERFTPRARLVMAMWNYESRFGQILNQKATVPKGCEGMPRERYVDFQEFLMSVAAPDKAVFHVEDSEASDGKALRVDASAAWFLQQPLELPPKAGERWKVLVTAKTDTEGLAPEAAVMTVGFYNGSREFGNIRFAAKDFAAKGYTTLEMPAIDASNNVLAFIMPHSASKTRPLFVDRVTVVRE
ncbi:MAG: DUF4838 domain-containing protein [Victivallales bacterium]|nr:DUF4838 domain-containing protein [Victivallales bacterium]